MIFEILAFNDWSDRRKRLAESVRLRVEQEGGEVDRVSAVDFLMRSPFPRLTIAPVFVRADCRYPDDWGAWFVYESQGRTLWCWRSDRGFDRLPTPRSDGSKVDNRTLALAGPVYYVVLVLMSAGLVVLFDWLQPKR